LDFRPAGAAYIDPQVLDLVEREDLVSVELSRTAAASGDNYDMVVSVSP
jgi:hypothetical protein